MVARVLLRHVCTAFPRGFSGGDQDSFCATSDLSRRDASYAISDSSSSSQAPTSNAGRVGYGGFPILGQHLVMRLRGFWGAAFASRTVSGYWGRNQGLYILRHVRGNAPIRLLFYIMIGSFDMVKVSGMQTALCQRHCVLNIDWITLTINLKISVFKLSVGVGLFPLNTETWNVRSMVKNVYTN